MADDLWYLNERGPDGKKLPSLRHGRGKRWRGRVPRVGESPLTQLFERQADAEAWEAKTRADLARGTYVDPEDGKVRLKDYIAEWLAAQRFAAPLTQENVERRIRRQILPHLGEYELTALRPSVIRAWSKSLPLADSTVRNVMRILSTILNAAVDDGRLQRNPFQVRSVKAPPSGKKRVTPWSVEQVEAIRADMPGQYAATVDVGWGLGLRQGETLGLAVEDVDWMKLTVHVRRQLMIVGGVLVFGPPKGDKDGDKERDVPLDGDVISLRLSAHLQAFPAKKITLPWRRPDGPPVTATLMFAPIFRHNFNTRYWKPALTGAGIAATREHGFHCLRHTFASTLLFGGVDIRALSEWLGHSDPGFTLRTYAHLMPAADDRARKAIGRALKGEREEMTG